MSCSALRSVRNSLAIASLALVLAACGTKTDRVSYEDIRTTQTAALLPKEIALPYLQKISSQQTSRTGESVIPPCQLTPTGVWSGGKYRKMTITGSVLSPMDIPDYTRWILYRVIDKDGDAFSQSEIDQPNTWSYFLRSPRTAKSLLGTVDHCVIGPTNEPPRKVVEALVSLGADIAAELAYIVPKR